ncbi:hypothetical protein C8J56DRAFT_777274 [Mycena floridula]|nr:hypothetical protein C8J56DRAFT_777274 [Mycena floridula]
MHWWYQTTTKSLADLDRLVHNVILQPDFDVNHLKDFSADRESKRLKKDNPVINDGDATISGAGWKRTSVTIPLPKTNTKNRSEADAPTLTVSGLYYRDLVKVMTTSVQDPSFKSQHVKGFTQMWKPSDDEPAQRVHGEAYTSDVYLGMQEEIQKLQPADETIEAVVFPMMVASDSTHLASFGKASLWPAYLWSGLFSKYTRSKPASFTANHIMYIPSLPETVQEEYREKFGTSPTAKVLTFLKSQLMHAIWALLLNAAFLDAYNVGIVIECADGILRRFFPRFFTYTADYPERVLLACVKSIGQCPCAICTIKKSDIPKTGTVNDMKNRKNKARVDTEHRQGLITRARKWIFEKGFAIGGAAIERLLGPTSQVPVVNAFSAALFQFGFNFYQMFVPDLLHEFEIGVWKAVFIHLIRILFAAGKEKVAVLNER